MDVFWALCMALNVYLALFQGWTAKRMRVQEWKYFVGCYGASFIPAFVYLFVKSDGRGKVYGPALVCPALQSLNPSALDHQNFVVCR